MKNHPFNRSTDIVKLAMITKYFSKVVVKFDPFKASAKPARLFLSSIPSSMRGACIINHKVLSKSSPASEVPIIEVTYKDKHVLKVDPEKMKFEEVRDQFDIHSRKLLLQDAISE